MTKTQKIEGWEAELEEFFFSVIDKPFQWGVQDCMTLACDSIKAMTGVDVLAGWARGKYSTKHEAIDIVRGHFGLSFLDTFAALFEGLGFEETTTVEYGDIAFVRVKNMDPEASQLFGGVTLATGFKNPGSIVCPGKAGLVVLKEFGMVRAWKP
jgi:hypothetical protein